MSTMSKLWLRIKLYWICLKYTLREKKLPPKALLRWVDNMPSEEDIRMGKVRLKKLKEKYGENFYDQ